MKVLTLRAAPLLDRALKQDVRLLVFRRSELEALGRTEAVAYLDTAIDSIEEARRELAT